MSNKFPITQEGFLRMEAELKDLKSNQRPQVSKEIAVAREHGDLKENAEYHAARDKQSFIEGRIADLEAKIAGAEVIDVSKLSGNIVKFGATVTLADEDDNEVTYQIVGEYEADLEKNRISIVSPMARAMVGKSVGEEIEVHTPRGTKDYEILSAEYK